MDSIPSILKGKKSIDARLESRYSFIGGQVAGINGVRLGVTFSRKIKFGGGVSWLSSDPSFQVTRQDGISREFLKFGYLCIYTDFVFHKTKRWQLSVPLQAGAGLVWMQQRRSFYMKGANEKFFFALYEPGITVQFKVFRWFGLGNDIAYRFVGKNNRYIPQRLSSPTYSFKLLFWPDQLFYELLPEHPLTQRFGPAYW